ncbi:MAG: response regulator, partial [Herminiimonas sp.]|nr:response regulator [Herminiimonas sp.]
RTIELETAHEQLRQSQKMEAIGQLTGGVAHDFNNVLQVIAGNLQSLQASVGNDPRAPRRLDTASFATDRGGKLASHLLALARPQPLQPLPTNLGRVLRGMDDLLRRSLGESVQIETVVAGGLWNTLVDPNQLENVILNLAINARDAMKGDGKLTLELGNATLDDQYASGQIDVVAGQYVMLAISDTGSGMLQSVIDSAFEPFSTTKREGEGTGLGLSMAYGFVKQSNGHIKIYSEVGNGTTIRIYLPHSFQREMEMTESEPEQIEGGTETILVVEDDEAVRATAVDILSGLGYRIITACDGENALQKLAEASHIDLLFTDVVMPGSLRSPELAKKAKEIFPDIDVLFTSGYTQNAIVHGGRLDPGVLLISKPYRKEELARKIRSILNSKPNPKGIVPQPELALVAHADNKTMAHPDVEIVPPAPGSLDILVVEDDPDAQMLVCGLLDLLGHRAHGVLSAEEAIATLSGARFDVLFTDITLPGMSGVQLARHVVEQSPDTKIIFSSGYGAVSPDDFNGASVCLPKPYDFDALQQVLTNLVASTSVR